MFQVFSFIAFYFCFPAFAEEKLPSVSLASTLAPFQKELEELTQEEFAKEKDLREAISLSAATVAETVTALKNAVAEMSTLAEDMNKVTVSLVGTGITVHGKFLASITSQLRAAIKQDANEMVGLAETVKKTSAALTATLKDQVGLLDDAAIGLFHLKNQVASAEDLHDEITEKADILLDLLQRRQNRGVRGVEKAAGDIAEKLGGRANLLEEFQKQSTRFKLSTQPADKDVKTPYLDQLLKEQEEKKK